MQPITLVEDPAGTPVNLLATADEGANAVFNLNGVAVSKPSNLINDVVPGISFHLAGTTSGSETVTLTLASDRSHVAGALQSLVSAYNHVSEQLDAQIGETAGLLSGNHLIRAVQTRLRAMTGYQGTGAIRSLAELGFQFDERGKAKFDPAALDALSDSQIQSAFGFLGSSTTGLGSFEKSFRQLSDSVTGLIKLQQDQYDTADKRLSEQIAVLTERITALQSRLSPKLQAADALLATLEQQQSLVDASVKSPQLVLYGRQEK